MDKHTQVMNLIDEAHIFAKQAVEYYHDKLDEQLAKEIELAKEIDLPSTWESRYDIEQQKHLVAHARAGMHERYSQFYLMKLKSRIYNEKGA